MELTEDGSLRKRGTTFDWTEAKSVAAAVIRAMARVSGKDPMELEPLYSVVDPDSLNALFETDRDQSELVVDFHYNGRRVQVSATGNGYIYPKG